MVRALLFFSKEKYEHSPHRADSNCLLCKLRTRWNCKFGKRKKKADFFSCSTCCPFGKRWYIIIIMHYNLGTTAPPPAWLVIFQVRLSVAAATGGWLFSPSTDSARLKDRACSVVGCLLSCCLLGFLPNLSSNTTKRNATQLVLSRQKTKNSL